MLYAWNKLFHSKVYLCMLINTDFCMEETGCQIGQQEMLPTALKFQRFSITAYLTGIYKTLDFKSNVL